MKFKFQENRNLPPLAWIAFAYTATGECHVEHGRLVETNETFFVEGVWGSSFSAGGFDRCESFFGSGGVLRPSGEFIFVPSSATVDYLYFKETTNASICSNSLPFLLAALGDRLNEFEPAYSRINDSVTMGIDRYEQRLPTRRGYVMRLMYYNLVITQDKPRRVPKALPPEFSSFDHYCSYFRANLGGIIKNAQDPARCTPLRILSTLSSGYDTTAVNAVARDYGLHHALSINESKEQYGYFKKRKEQRPTDSGQTIAQRLGIDLSIIDRRYFLTDPSSEHLYWAGTHNCQDLNLHQIREYVGDGAILLTGHAGGRYWRNAGAVNKDQLSSVNDQLERGDLSGLSLSEARLHTGYVHVAAPFIGARSHKSLFDLGNSDEMRPWSIGGTYDRPIPRRIGEDAGVPRDAFGRFKLATVVESLPPYVPHCATLRTEFLKFFRRKQGIFRTVNFLLAIRLNYMLVRVNQLGQRAARIGFFPRPPNFPMVGNHLNAVLYAYCVNKIVEFYKLRGQSNFCPRESTKIC
jgi:hypothetical protein